MSSPPITIIGATDIPEDFYVELEGLRALEEPFAQFFDASQIRQDKILHWLMRSRSATEEDIRDLTDQGILLLGDAIHTMPILGGEGANMAIKDGVDLAEHLAEHGLSRINDFYDGRNQMWRQAVEDSEKRLSDMRSPVKPLL